MTAQQNCVGGEDAEKGKDAKKCAAGLCVSLVDLRHRARLPKVGNDAA
jgi:hypothetical protein